MEIGRMDMGFGWELQFCHKVGVFKGLCLLDRSDFEFCRRLEINVKRKLNKRERKEKEKTEIS